MTETRLDADAKLLSVEAATARLLIELAFLLPKGTDLNTHPIGQKLIDFKRAIEWRALHG